MRKSTLSQIKNHATAQYPNECCGVVILSGKKEQYIPLKNHAGNESEHFIISAKDYANAEDKGKIVAVVHSHPDWHAGLSEADRVMLNNGAVQWLVVAVGKDGVVDVQTYQPDNWQAPLIGREFFHGVLDCYTLIRDYYQRELGITIPDFQREDDWWDKGQNLYEDNFANAGFYEIPPDKMQAHDVLLFRVNAPTANHGGIFLGDYQLKSEPVEVQMKDAMLHHLFGRLSNRTYLNSYWLDKLVKVVRHEQTKNS